MPDKPTITPNELNLGDTWTWTRSFSKYPPGTWTLVYYFSQLIGTNPSAFNIQASIDPDDSSRFLIDVDSKDNDILEGAGAGNYRFMAKVNFGEETYTVEEGDLIINADISDGPDLRTKEEKILDSIETAMLGMATGTSKKYIISTPDGERMFEQKDYSDLLLLRDRYKQIVLAQKRKRRGLSGGSMSVEFRRP